MYRNIKDEQARAGMTNQQVADALGARWHELERKEERVVDAIR